MYRDKDSLNDIGQAGERALKLSQGLSPTEIEADEMRLSAIAYHIIVMGEATARLSSTFRENHPDVLWESLLEMRDIPAWYCDIPDFSVLKTTLYGNIPNILNAINPLIAELPD